MLCIMYLPRVRSPETEDADGCEPPKGSRELNPSSARAVGALNR